MFDQVENLWVLANALGEHARIPLVGLALPALRQMSAADYDRFQRNVQSLITADQQVDLFEFALQKMLRRHLDPRFKSVPQREVTCHSLQGIRYDTAIVLSALAHVGGDTVDRAQAAFQVGVRQLNTPTLEFKFMSESDCTLNTIEIALDHLCEATPELKKRVLGACVQTVAADGFVRPREAELLRAIGDALDCPIPPFVTEAGGPSPARAEAIAA